MTDAISPTPTYNSAAYFTEPLVNPYGLREYDARWIVEPIAGDATTVDINYQGILQVGNYLGRFLQTPAGGARSQVLIAHDFRAYSQNVQHSLALGLLSSGIDVVDIGLATTPVAYHAQYAYDVPAIAMVTASHNANGWTGVKMGTGFSSTFTAEQMTLFKDFVAAEAPMDTAAGGGRYERRTDAVDRYIADLTEQWAPRLEGLPRLRVAVETGNGTAGLVVPHVLRNLGFDVACGNVELDWNFPNFNPNPESIPFLRAVEELVLREQADLGLCFDGDADRLGVVDETGKLVFSDRVGLLLAQRIEREVPRSRFVVDVKSTSLFNRLLNSPVTWVPTGHSYVKNALSTTGSSAAFERSGHIFLAAPYGRGYDDACVAALLLLAVLCDAAASGSRLSGLLAGLPPSTQSPTRQPKVPDSKKYQVVDEVSGAIHAEVARTGSFAGDTVARIVTTNGVRVEYSDGSWFLIRASSNTPNLVVVAEAFAGGAEQLQLFDKAVRDLLGRNANVSPFEPLHTV